MQKDGESGHQQHFEFTEEMKIQAQRIVESDSAVKSTFWYDKFEKESCRNWDIFYHKNQQNFFNDRNYLDKEFPELLRPATTPPEVFCEFGCGVGNALFPLLEKTSLSLVGFDFSKRAIECIEKDPKYLANQSRMSVSVADLVLDPIPTYPVSPHLGSLIFVLCAIAPEHHVPVMTKIYEHLQPQGILFFRDYARYDQAQLRFSESKSHKLKEHFYVKSDGTRCFYFDEAYCQALFESVGFRVIENKTHSRLIQNKKKQLDMYRQWIQCRLQK